MRKIVCLIAKVSSPGGAEHVMTELCNGFAAGGTETVLIAQNAGQPFYPLDPRVRYVNLTVAGRPHIPFSRFLRLRRILRRERPDAVLTFITETNLIAIAAAAGLHIPVVVSERSDPKLHDAGWAGRLRRLLYPKAAGFVFQTEDARDFFPEAIRARAAVIPNAISTAIRQKTDYATHGRAIAVGRFSTEKDYPTMLAAYARFHADHPHDVLEIYGGGRGRAATEEQIRSLGLDGCVRPMGVSQQIGELLAEADFYVMSSAHEGMPNALMEAMAAGLPCISTDCPCGGPASLIRDGENGLLIPVGDAEALAAAMARLASDGALRETLGQHALRIRQTFAPEKIVARWEAYIECCIRTPHEQNHLS